MAPAYPLRLRCELAGKPLIFQLPAAAVAARLLGLGLIELQAVLPVIEGRLARGDALPLIDEEFAQGFRLLLPDRDEVACDFRAPRLRATAQFRL